MKKIILKLLFASLLLLAQKVYSQYVELNEGSQVIAAPLTKDGSSIREVDVNFRLSGPASKDVAIKLEIIPGGVIANPTFLIDTFLIKKENFNVNKSKIIKHTFYIKFDKIDLTDTLVFYIRSANNTNGNLVTVIIPKMAVKATSPIKSEDGTNSAKAQTDAVKEPGENDDKKNDCGCFTILEGDTLINPVISKNKTTGLHKINLKIKLNKDCPSINKNENTEVEVKLVNVTTLPASPELINTKITILPEQWKKGSDTVEESIYLKTTSIDSTILNDENCYLTINNCDGMPTAMYLIRISRNGMYQPNKPFWIELGANFDVAEGFKPTNLFAGIFLYKRDVLLIGKNKRRGFSFLGGVYESKTSSSSITSDSGLSYRDGRTYIEVPGSGYPIFRDTGILKATATSTNVGLFFSPQFRITRRAADSDGFHLFVSFWAEQLWQTTKTEFDYSGLDSISGPNGISYVPRDSIGNYKIKQKDGSVDNRSHYFGLGLPMYLKDGLANLYINPVVWGITNQPFFSKLLDSKGNAIYTTEKRWHSFYLMQFRLSEEKFGFTFTGEIRGLWEKDTKPFISIALSKKIDLDNIGDYVQKILRF